MILNTFLKTKKINLTAYEKKVLGRRFVSCYKSVYPDIEVNKVSISENGVKMSVIDYPKEFLESQKVNKILSRFKKKFFKNKGNENNRS